MYKLTSIVRNRQYAIHKYDTTIGFFHIFLNGNTGTIYGLEGRGIFKGLANNLDLVYDECKIDIINAVMEPHVVQKIEKFLNCGYELEVGKELKYDGKRMFEISITKKVGF